MAQKTALQPLGKRVVVKPDVVEEKTSGGLYVPPTASEDKKPESGTVEVLGLVSDKEFKFSVKVGDRVYFKKYSPDEVEVDGNKYLIISEKDILAVIK